jgi:hypothetical protein
LEDNIIMELLEIEWNRVDWIHLAQVTDKWQAPLSMVMNLGSEIVHWLRSWLLKRRTLLPRVSQSVSHNLQTWCVTCVNCCVVYRCGHLWHLRFSQECMSTSGAFSALRMAAVFPCTVLHSVIPQGCVHLCNSK